MHIYILPCSIHVFIVFIKISYHSYYQAFTISIHIATCSLPSERGSCVDYTIYWYYDISSGSCRRFWYGGCEGNANRFKSRDHCQSFCAAPPGTGKKSNSFYNLPVATIIYLLSAFDLFILLSWYNLVIENSTLGDICRRSLHLDILLL